MEKLEIDTERLKSELLRVKKYYEGNPFNKDILNDYFTYKNLASILNDMTNEDILTNASYDYLKFLRMKIDDIRSSSLTFNDYLNEYVDFINLYLSAYFRVIEEIKFVNVKENLKEKEYSLRELKEIILDYYSKVGDFEYSVAKKYFQEGRIQMEHKEMKLFNGFFASIIYDKFGYIFLNGDKINSLLLSTLTHEIGHAIDYEKHYFQDIKYKDSYNDLVSEVPSTYYEIGIMKFLRENGIDEFGGSLLLQEFYMYIILYCKHINMLAVEKEKYGRLNINTTGKIILHDGSIINVVKDIKYMISDYLTLFLQSKDRDSKETVKMLHEVLSKRYECNLYDFLRLFQIEIDDFVCAKGIKNDIIDNNNILKKKCE